MSEQKQARFGEEHFTWIVGITVAVAVLDMVATLTQHQVTNLLTLGVFAIIAGLRLLAGYFIVAGQQWFFFILAYLGMAFGLIYCLNHTSEKTRIAAVVIAVILLVPLFPTNWVTFLAWKL